MTAPTVHWQQPGLMAMSETDGHGDTCGPIVILDYVALLGKVTLSVQSIDDLRQELISSGLMKPGGMTLPQVTQALTDVYGVQIIKTTGYQANLDMNQYHTDLKNAMLAHQLVIVETSKAYEFPGNQSGVEYHFVLIGGIDSNEGYYTANGDTEQELSSTQPQTPVWYSWAVQSSVVPCGYTILPAIPEVAEMIAVDKNAGGTVTGAHDTDNGKTIGAGFALAAQQNNLLSLDILVGETDIPGLPAFAVLGPSTGPQHTLTYSSGSGVQDTNNGDVARVVAGLAEALANAPKSQPAPPETPKINYNTVWNGLSTALALLHSAMQTNGELT